VSGVAVRTELPGWLVVPSLLGFVAVVGMLAGYDPKLAIAAALGVGFLLIALTDLGVGVAIFAVLTFLELAPAIGGPALSFSKAAGLVLALSWLALVTAQPRSTPLLFTAHPGLTAALAFLLAWVTLSVVWAEDQAAAISTVSRWLLNAALIPIVFTAVRSASSARLAVGALAVGATLAAVYGLAVSPDASGAATSLTAAGDLNRIAGTVGDPNLLASLLVVGIVAAMAFVLDPQRASPTRWLAAGCAAICLLGVLQTLSRGGLLALTAALVAAIVFGGSRRPALIGFSALVAIVAVFYFTSVAPPDAVERVTKSDGGTGRTDIWKVGWRMVEANPATGIGVGNFNVSSIHYLLVEPGAIARSEFIVDTPAVAHNVYLEILAELGIVGLVLFLTVIGISLTAAGRAAGRFARSGDVSLELLARAVLVGTLALLAADFFISAQFSKQLWLLLGLGPALLGIAMRQEKERAGAAEEEHAAEPRLSRSQALSA
jgi:O-antigen ligase